MGRRFRGESHHKVDAKGRVSIPASFRRVIEAADPNWTDGLNPELVIVYGDHRRNYLECYTMEAIDEVDAKIALDAEAFFIAAGDTFQIWKPETYETEELAKTEDWLDELPDDFDPLVYLDGPKGD